MWVLELLFKICLLPTKTHSSIGWLHLNTFTCVHSSFVGYGTCIFILSIRVLKEGDLVLLFMSVWNFTMATVYLILSYQQRQTPDLIERLRNISRPGSHPLLHWTGAMNFTRVCKGPVVAAICLWLLNVSFVVIDARTLVTHSFGLSDSIVYIVCVALSSFHIQLLVWFVPVPIIFTGCYFLSAKVQTVYKVFETEFSKKEGDIIDLVSLTELYMEMFELNRSLNNCLSFLFTFVNATLAFVFLFIILANIVDSSSLPGSTVLLWSVLNLFVMGPMCYSAADLEAWNTKFFILLGEFPLHAHTSVEAMLQYSTLRAKVSSCPFGVYIYGSLSLVSYSRLGDMASLWVSVFVFVAGVVSLN